MPQMSGLDFINKIIEIDTNCKIKTIIISAYIKDNIPYDKSYIMKIDKILEKPVYLDRLKIEIQQLLTIDIKEKYYKQIGIFLIILISIFIYKKM